MIKDFGHTAMEVDFSSKESGGRSFARVLSRLGISRVASVIVGEAP